ncbi:MAG TPA: DUF5915 domain-containing protein, partial [Candidatus Paceibacterota bacterium]
TSDADKEVLRLMSATRSIVSQALEARDKAKIKVRQPLSKLTVGATDNFSEATPGIEHYKVLIQEEVNVKKVSITRERPEIVLDTDLTNELREEGMVRDIVREIQAFRKESGLKPGESTTYTIPEQHDKQLIEKHQEEIERATNTKLDFNLEPRP